MTVSIPLRLARLALTNGGNGAEAVHLSERDRRGFRGRSPSYPAAFAGQQAGRYGAVRGLSRCSQRGWRWQRAHSGGALSSCAAGHSRVRAPQPWLLRRRTTPISTALALRTQRVHLQLQHPEFPFRYNALAFGRPSGSNRHGNPAVCIQHGGSPFFSPPPGILERCPGGQVRRAAELIELGQHEVREVRSGLFAGGGWIRTLGPR